MLSSWLHLLAFAAYVGSVIGLWVFLLPKLSTTEDPQQKLRFLASSLKIYNPVQTGALGLLVMSGAFQLTHLKETYRELFLKQVGFTLSLKLTLSFLLVMVSVYQAMGVGHRFVRRHETGDPFSSRDLQSIIRRLQVLAAAMLLLVLMTAWLGFSLG